MSEAERTASQSIESGADVAGVLRVLSNPLLIPLWAPPFADAVQSDGDRGWQVIKGENTFPLRLVIHPDAGTVDYLRRIASGQEGGAYLRVVPRPGGGSVITMTAPIAPGVLHDDAVAGLRTELEALDGLVGCSG